MLNIELEVIDRCPYCGSGNLAFWCRGRDRLLEIDERQYLYSRCTDCGLLFLSLRPREEYIGRYYPENYGPYVGGAKSGVDDSHRTKHWAYQVTFTGLRGLCALFRKLFPQKLEQRLREFYTPARAESVLLDFGCGSSSYLDIARRKGWRTIGCDFSARAVDAARAGQHEAHLCADLWSNYQSDVFDVVRMNHVFEHLYTPFETLSALSIRLKQEGRIHVAVPNPAAAGARLFRTWWRGLDCPRHIMLFPPRLLTLMVERAGFEEVKIYYEVVTKDLAGSIGYLLEDRGGITRSSAVALPFNPDLMNALYIPARVFSWFGISDRLHLFARKAKSNVNPA